MSSIKQLQLGKSVSRISIFGNALPIVFMIFGLL